MASQSIHIATANRFHGTLEFLCDDVSAHAPWIATVAFYKALHVIEAAFAADPKIGHTNCHGERRDALMSATKYQNVHRHYSALEKMSKCARYLYTDSGTVATFDKYLPPEKIGEQVLFHRLKQVESSCGKWMKKDADQLISVETLRSKFT